MVSVEVTGWKRRLQLFALRPDCDFEALRSDIQGRDRSPSSSFTIEQDSDGRWRVADRDAAEKLAALAAKHGVDGRLSLELTEEPLFNKRAISALVRPLDAVPRVFTAYYLHAAPPAGGRVHRHSLGPPVAQA